MSLRGGWWRTFRSVVEVSWGSWASGAAWASEMPPWSEILVVSWVWFCSDFYQNSFSRWFKWLYVHMWLCLNFKRLVPLQSQGTLCWKLLFWFHLISLVLCTHTHTHKQKQKKNNGVFYMKLLYLLICSFTWFHFNISITSLSNWFKEVQAILWRVRHSLKKKKEMYIICTTTSQGPVDDSVNWLPSSSQRLTSYLFNEATLE